MANSILHTLYEEISDAYVENNAEDGIPYLTDFEAKYFKSIDEMNKYAVNPSNIEDMFCFALHWNRFDTETNQFDLQIRYGLSL